jgi:SNF2 family DNA or RNA helicase
MMVKLKADGHRVLIYSQFTRMLDILEDWIHDKVGIFFLMTMCVYVSVYLSSLSF